MEFLENIGRGDSVYISTYGCQMNEHDTERMLSLLETHKFLEATSPEQADVIIINSCSVREKPVHKVMSEIGTYRPLKERNPKLKLGVAGCVGQQEGRNLLKDAPLLDFVFGTDTIDMLPTILHEVRDEGKRDAWTRMGHREEYSIETMIRNTKVSAFVTITKGCDNFCSFCVVPFTRGREKSRLLSELIKDVRSLSERGVREVTLLGQNVNSYKSPDGRGGFSDLLRAVCTETDIARVRFTTSHPKDFDDELISVLVKYQEKLGHYVHLPAQSGSTKILERMNRGYTREEYLAKARRLKEALPGLNLSTDMIVGFPGETEEDFKLTLSLLSEVRYENVYGFKYSPRPFTKALMFTDQIPEELKEERLERIIEFQDTLSEEICRKYDSKTFQVLVEGPSKNRKEIMTGRTTHNKVVNFACPENKRETIVGKVVSVKIVKAQPFSLRGELV